MELVTLLQCYTRLVEIQRWIFCFATWFFTSFFLSLTPPLLSDSDLCYVQTVNCVTCLSPRWHISKKSCRSPVQVKTLQSISWQLSVTTFYCLFCRINIVHFFIFEFPCIISIIYNKPTRCDSGSIVFIKNYKYALHVSDALCVHLQEHYI